MNNENEIKLKQLAKGLTIKGLRERSDDLTDSISGLADQKKIYDDEIKTRVNKIPNAISIKNPGCYCMSIKFDVRTGKTKAVYCGHKNRNINLKECEACDQRCDNDRQR